MAALPYTQYALLALALLFLAAQRCRDGPTPAACVSMPIAAGLCYDHVALALGGALLAGPLLLALNWPRHLLQALIAPSSSSASPTSTGAPGPLGCPRALPGGWPSPRPWRC